MSDGPSLTDRIRALGPSFYRFTLSSAFSFLFNLGFTIFLHEIVRLPEPAAFAIALVTVFLLNFVLMRYYVYPGQTMGVGRQFVMHATASVGFRVSEYLGFLALHSLLHVHYVIASSAVLVVSFFVKFFVLRQVVFARSDARDDKAG